jgi:hypothetical protein
MILRFATHAVSLWHVLDESGWKGGTWEGCWEVFWAGHRRRGDQVRIVAILVTRVLTFLHPCAKLPRCISWHLGQSSNRCILCVTPAT